MSEVIRIELGVSIFSAEVIAAALTAEGIGNELLRNEHAETGAANAIGTCALLVAAGDEDRAREIIAKSGY